ncbi:MAG: pyridoxamine 5'-phosphate oxidase family protein [Candidatus Omnitrophica bacterium]|nr:pyridoxamine 5'-phosphate oxidase family protein [Candidatus Omnitrophota bacterium]
MKQIPSAVTEFLRNQGFVIVASIDKNGFPHSSCKDIVKIEPAGKIYAIDAYCGMTAENIKHNPQVSVSAVDEHKFMGYCLKGRARVMTADAISQEFIRSWENNITSRLAKRLLHNLAQDKSRAHHPEASLPRPQHLIIVTVEEIVNLTPYYLRKG